MQRPGVGHSSPSLTSRQNKIVYIIILNLRVMINHTILSGSGFTQKMFLKFKDTRRNGSSLLASEVKKKKKKSRTYTHG